MPRRKSWPSVLFLHDKQKLQRIRGAPACGYHVGVWWHDDDRLVAFLQSISEIKAERHRIESDFSHDSAWETARHELTCRQDTRYFDIPHGRVVWDTIYGSGVLYHGNATPKAVFEKLARLFRLPRWEARLDEDYLTGEALNEFYLRDF